jgi:hypothetical protein
VSADRFPDEFSRLLRETTDRLSKEFPEGMVVEYAQQTPMVQVHKLQAYAPVSCCVLTDTTGENHCEHPPPPPPPPIPWRRRLRWRLRARWDAFRLRLGSWVAGVDLNEREDW